MISPIKRSVGFYVASAAIVYIISLLDAYFYSNKCRPVADVVYKIQHIPIGTDMSSPTTNTAVSRKI